jgi:hypothetical protein
VVLKPGREFASLTPQHWADDVSLRWFGIDDPQRGLERQLYGILALPNNVRVITIG